MTCPVCNHDTQVTYTYDRDDHVIRDRKCRKCGYRFQTIEIDEDMNNQSEETAKIQNLKADIKEFAMRLLDLGDKYD